ncbi:MAG: RNA methyltransferase [Chlorobi bacterium]|nr:RNA methyltransferase [Chlorobiota bacterium]
MELPLLSKAHIRRIARLHTKRHREEDRLFIAEGIRTVEELARSHYRARFLLCTRTAADEHLALVKVFRDRGVPVYAIDQQVFARLADTKSPQGMLAIVEYPDEQPSAGNIIAFDGVADPGNAGTIARTALLFGYRQLVFGNNSVDRYHPKFVRATMGALFHLHTTEQRLDTFLASMATTHSIIGAVAHGGMPLAQLSVPDKPHVLVIGSEAYGLSPSVEEHVTDRVTIEGAGSFDSLNAAVAAGIIMYHLFRPR